MMRRYGWIAAVLSLGLAGAAQAQQMENEQQGTGQQPEAQKGQESGQGKQQQKSQRLSSLEAQGIQLSALDKEQVKEVQSKLQESGYYTGELDGDAGPSTKQALSQFYRDQAQLAAQGKILPEGATALGLQEADIERVRGEEGTKGMQGEQQGQQQREQQQEPSGAQQPSAPPPSGQQPMEQDQGMQDDESMQHQNQGTQGTQGGTQYDDTMQNSDQPSR